MDGLPPNTDDILKSPRIQPLSERIRGLRRARRLTQLQLATLADVSERTIRNAEKGLPVRLASLAAISVALDADYEDLVNDREQLLYVQNSHGRASLVLEMLQHLATETTSLPLRDVSHSGIRLRINGPVWLPNLGEYRGFDQLDKWDAEYRKYQERVPRGVRIEEIHGAGDFVIARGCDIYPEESLTTKQHAWWTNVLQFEEGRVVRVESVSNPLLRVNDEILNALNKP